MRTVYHFTDIARLPWILCDGELRAGANKLGGYPDPDFLWATTDARGDLSASGYRDYRRGSLLVRFTLSASDFEPWEAAIKKFPQWTDQHINRLKQAGLQMGARPENWLIRVAPLPSTAWGAIDTKMYSGNWRKLENYAIGRFDGGLGILTDEKVYLSQKVTGPGGGTAYAFMQARPEDLQMVA